MALFVFLGEDALMVGQRTVNPWLRQVGSIPIFSTNTEGYVTWDVTAVLKAAGAERPGVRFCHPSAKFMILRIVIAIKASIVRLIRGNGYFNDY